MEQNSKKLSQKLKNIVGICSGMCILVTFFIFYINMLLPYRWMIGGFLTVFGLTVYVIGFVATLHMECYEERLVWHKERIHHMAGEIEELNRIMAYDDESLMKWFNDGFSICAVPLKFANHFEHNDAGRLRENLEEMKTHYGNMKRLLESSSISKPLAYRWVEKVFSVE